MRARLAATCLLGALSLGCDEAPATPDVGLSAGPWIDDALTPAERIHWPGVDHAGGRVVSLVNGFANDAPSSYWFFGLAGRETDDVFLTCREGDDACPLTRDGRIAWDRVVGKPLLARVPGDPRYSPWWQLWTVRVGSAYEPDSIRTIGQLFRAVGLGTARVDAEVLEDGRAALVHLPLVLRGTELEGNGGAMPDGTGRKLAIDRLEGWRQGLLVAFFDFSRSEGVFGASADGEARPRMPFANIYTFYRVCDGGAADASICSVSVATAESHRLLSERGLGQDITGDGDLDDTNTVLGALPGAQVDVAEPPYSPLWAVSQVEIPRASPLRFVDDTRDQARSDVTSAADIRAAVARGDLSAPAPVMFPAGSDTPLFFNCPAPVPAP